LEEHAEDLAHHFWSAGAAADPSKTVRYLQIAGDKGVRSSANVEAISHFKRALQLVTNLPETTERLRQELSLQTTIGTTLLPTKGFSSPEVNEAFTRARELSRQTGVTEQFFRVLFGQWLSHSSRAENRTAIELGEQCLQLAQSAADAGLLLEAHHALGVSRLITADLGSALHHFERTIATYDPTRHRDHSQMYGHHPAAVCLMHLSHVLWLLGYPDQALKRSNDSLSLAQQVNHPSTLATNAAFVAFLRQWRGDVSAVEELCASAIAISTRHDFGFYRAMAVILGGWALVQRGRTAEGIEQMRSGLETFRGMGGVTLSAYFSALLAEAYTGAGQRHEALEVLDRVEDDLEPWWKAEICRLRGEVRVLESARRADKDEAQEYFREAIDIARAQKAKSLELRATMSLCRLGLAQSKRYPAHQMLKDIMGSFTEGFDTRDLSEAQLLLESL
jgi:predicted ATPase